MQTEVTHNFLKTLNTTFYSEGGKTSEQVVWAGFGISVLGDIQNQTGHGPEQPASVTKHRGLADLQRSLPISAIFLLCEIQTVVYFYNTWKDVKYYVILLPIATPVIG